MRRAAAISVGIIFLPATIILCLLPSMGQTAEARPPAALAIELNKSENISSGCQLTFVATNRLGTDLGEAAFEFALFDTNGLIARMAVFNFQELPGDQTKVRQFTVEATLCSSISRVHVNGAATCSGTGIDTRSCMANLVTSARSTISFGK